ncbi:hypothetical protein SAMN05444487_10790 [Marininema mesophilum]|uniref:Uncharacterized protein n=1 Tax=Marininema mesophilum TaxID=1048340 RepID=A0A1H2X737_9BACL|nr:hypothetical protein SAMN05444487_10790 [Marininema mesophilum]
MFLLRKIKQFIDWIIGGVLEVIGIALIPFVLVYEFFKWIFKKNN